MDGSYRAEGNAVLRSPTKTKTGFRMGFPVAQVNEHISEPDKAAQLLADALNEHRAAHPEMHD